MPKLWAGRVLFDKRPTDELDAAQSSSTTTPTASTTTLTASTTNTDEDKKRGRPKSDRSDRTYPPFEKRRRSSRLDWPCEACQANLRKDDVRHTRHPEDCKWPLTEQMKWTCPGCLANADRGDDRHTYQPGECKWHGAPVRAGAPREGHHPRDPRLPHHGEPTASLQPNPDQRDETPEESRALEESTSTASSSRDSGPRGPYTKTTETGSQSAERGIDWSTWDLGRSLQLLRSANPAVVRRTLRLLHIRWWHASAKKMMGLLKAANAPASAISQVDEIVDTCKACRMWARTPPASAATSRVIEKFNQVMQHDLMFVLGEGTVKKDP